MRVCMTNLALIICIKPMHDGKIDQNILSIPSLLPRGVVKRNAFRVRELNFCDLKLHYCLPKHHLRHASPATMDNLNITPETAASLQNLSAKDKQELNQFVIQEGTSSHLPSTSHPSHTPTSLTPRLVSSRPKGPNPTNRPLPHRHLFPEMRHEQDLVGPAGWQERGAVYAELRRSVHGCEYDRHSAFGEDEDIGMRQSWDVCIQRV